MEEIGGPAVPDLGALRKRATDEEKARALAATEVQLGLRCGGCYERIVEGGWEVFVIDFGRAPDGSESVRVERTVTCSGRGGECDLGERLAPTATAMRPLPRTIFPAAIF